MLKILLINLKSANDRLQFQAAQLDKLGLEFERIEASTTNDFNDTEYQKLGFSWQRPLRPVELACSLSHRKAWLKVIDENSPCFIIEDDAYMAKEMKFILTELESNTHFDMISLETRARRKIISKSSTTLSNEYSLHNLIQDKCGAAGYILWPSGALKLINDFDTNNPAIADAMIAHCRHLKSGQIVPAALIQLDCCEHYHIPQPLDTQSTISIRSPKDFPARNFLEKITFKFRRIKAQFRLAIKQVANPGVYKDIKIHKTSFHSS